MPVLRSPKLIRGGVGGTGYRGNRIRDPLTRGHGEVRTHDGGDDGSGGERRVGGIQKERL